MLMLSLLSDARPSTEFCFFWSFSAVQGVLFCGSLSPKPGLRCSLLFALEACKKVFTLVAGI